MGIDTIIIFLLVAIALVAIVILLKGGSEKKIYDPNDVDLSHDFDPQHHHFSQEHARKLNQQKKSPVSFSGKKRTSPTSVVAKASHSEVNREFDGLEHLKRPVNVESQQSKGHKNRRETTSRRMGENRRSGDRRSRHDRRDK